METVIDAYDLRHGVYVTLIYFAVYFGMLLQQSITSQVLARTYKNKEKPFVKLDLFFSVYFYSIFG